MDIECLGGAGLGLDRLVRAVGFENLGVSGIAQIGRQNLLDDLGPMPRIFHRKEDFDSPVEIALHHVRTAEVNLLVASVVEMIDAAVLEEPPYDAPRPDRLTPARNTGPQAAHASHDEIDLDTGNRGPV